MRAKEFWRAVMDRLVYPSHANGGITRINHERFIAFNLITGLGALALLPIYLASHIPPASEVVNLLMVYSLNIFVALAVSQTGLTRPAVHVHAIAAAWGIAALCMATGGMSSFALPCLLLLPMGGALLMDKNIVSWQIGAAGSALLLLFVGGMAGLVLNRGFDTTILGLGAGSFVMVATLVQIAVFAALPGHGAREEEGSTSKGEEFEPLLDVCILEVDGKGETLGVCGSKSLGLPLHKKVSLEAVRERLHLHDAPAFMQALSECIHRPDEMGGTDLLKVRLRLQDESWTLFRVAMQAGRNEKDGAVTALISLRNISEEDRRRLELDKALHLADQASHAKSRFLSSVSHELRTPLNAVIGFSDILSEEHFGTLDQNQVREYARIIRDSGQTLLHFVNQIIALSKIEAGSVELIAEPFDVAPMLRGVVDEFRSEIAAKNLRLDLVLEENPDELIQDGRACARVIKQILSNAVKFSPEGGTIRLTAAPEWHGVKITIADEGPGIPPGAEGQMSQPFAKLNTSYSAASEGAGLGLTIARGLIELQGGRMEFSPAGAGGTQVEIFFPALGGNVLSLETALEEGQSLRSADAAVSGLPAQRAKAG